MPPCPPRDNARDDQADRFVRPDNQHRVGTVAVAPRSAGAAHGSPVRIAPGHFGPPPFATGESPASGSSSRR